MFSRTSSLEKLHQKPTKTLSQWVFVSILLALLVISLGAYTRLTHAGLGCPDWPGCYGLFDVPETTAQIAKAEQAFPNRPVEPAKAWNEMIHRYFAGLLGLAVLVIAVMSFYQRKQGSPVKLPLLLLAVVVFQAALGMWTVTLKLMPIVVMGHLLGGFTSLSLLWLLYLRLKKNQMLELDDTQLSGHQYSRNSITLLKRMRIPAVFGMLILVVQIALGGWTSSNYAALVCVELPICQQGWQKQLTFSDSFNPIPPHKNTYEFGHLNYNERVTIHVTHRIGAIVTTVYLVVLTLIILLKNSLLVFKKLAGVVLALLIIQVSLGVSNIWFSLPLAVAVSHNVIAALLLLSMIALTYFIFTIKNSKIKFTLTEQSTKQATNFALTNEHSLGAQFIAQPIYGKSAAFQHSVSSGKEYKAYEPINTCFNLDHSNSSKYK